ncbi:MAG: acetyltransferase [Lachnospiraceae bacterium]|nr:acetyltransferase [Lachnospiraceae bacterium]MBQ3602106.1 acetyltransferase [Lachnospiraceae bacterium]
MYDRIIVYGCGGHARSVLSTLMENGLSTNIVLVDENAKANEEILGCKVVKEIQPNNRDRMIVAIGDNRKRKELFSMLTKETLATPMNVISQYSLLRNDVSMGKGIFISGNSYIGPEVRIGDNSIINTASLIEHEVMIGNHSHIAPNSVVCGRTIIGDEVLIGAGSTIIDNIEICNRVVIGAGSTVIKNIMESGIYVGNPVRMIRKFE